jgi:hypothetical protein
MNAAHRLIVFVGLCFIACGACAYEQASHGLITRYAFAASDLGGTTSDSVASLTRGLGLDGFAPFGRGIGYFEFAENLAGLSAFGRTTQDYERGMLKDLGVQAEENFTLTWLMYGAIREDDNPSEDPPTPQDVTPGLKRPLNHFFDPIFNRPLEASGLILVEGDVHKNPDWAIGSFDSFADPNMPEPQRKNHFTVMDAREAMFRALTLLTYNGTGYPDIAAGVDAATRQQWRQAYWATTFRALGDVLHLNQDMAQPQHTRNEPHSGKLCPGGKLCLAGHTSVYEKYINTRALLQTSFSSGYPFNARVTIPAKPLATGSYPIPAFAKYTDYWSTSPGNVNLPGKGLADYSNRGFFTAGKNFDSTEYSSPSTNPSRYVIASFTPTRWDGSASTDSTPTHVYYGEVADAWQQTSTANVALTTYSLWDQFVRAQSGAPAYSLNRLNYDAMADHLLPRAVAYSAGLINFFFRGRIEIQLPDEGVFALADHASDQGFTMVRAKIGNQTPTFVDAQGNPQPQHMSGGQFFAVIRYHTDKQYVDSLDTVVGAAPCTEPMAVINAEKPDASTQCRDGVEQIIVSRPVYGVVLQANEQKLVEFEFGDSPIPFDITDAVLQVVYRGELGSEADAVAVGTVDVSEPTYFTYQNASDYIHLGEHVYTRGQVDSDIDLLAQVQPQYCVDYRQSPPHLVEGCLSPFELDLTVSFGDLAKPVAKVVGLPNHRFIRFAYLTVSDEGFNPPVTKSTTRTVKLAARRHGADEKAMLNQDGTCLPHDPFNITPRHAQLSVIAPNQVLYRLGRFGKLRGVNGWLSVSCVENGDNSTPGAPDDRVEVMTPLTPLSEEVQPYAVTIMPEYL